MSGDVYQSQQIIITFDQVIDTSTLDESTFSLTFPAPAQVINSTNLISGHPAPSTVNVHGNWGFATNANNQTVATFTPEKPFQQNTLYTAMLLGTDAALTSEDIQNPGGESMAMSYAWTFTTGVLQLQTRSLRPAEDQKLTRSGARRTHRLRKMLVSEFTPGKGVTVYVQGRFRTPELEPTW